MAFDSLGDEIFGKRKRHSTEEQSRSYDDDAQYISYEEYLLSNAWQELREKIVQRDGGRCVFCDSKDRLQIHHRTYERIYNEGESDLHTLCGKCHKHFHRRAA